MRGVPDLWKEEYQNQYGVDSGRERQTSSSEGMNAQSEIERSISLPLSNAS